MRWRRAGRARRSTWPVRWRSTSVGHYIAYLEHKGAWYCLNDDQVIEGPGDLEEMLGDASIVYYE